MSAGHDLANSFHICELRSSPRPNVRATSLVGRPLSSDLAICRSLSDNDCNETAKSNLVRMTVVAHDPEVLGLNDARCDGKLALHADVACGPSIVGSAGRVLNALRHQRNGHELASDSKIGEEHKRTSQLFFGRVPD